MATVKKSKKKIIVPICIILVIAIAVGAIFSVSRANKGEEVSLYTIGTDDIYQTVSLTGEVSAGTVKEYKVGSVATVKEVFVNVGDNVKKGDVLATFDTESLNSQINALQLSYNDSLKSYNESVKAQKTAKAKADELAKKIKELEKQISNLEKNASTTKKTTTGTTAAKQTTTTTTTKKKTTTKSTSTTSTTAKKTTTTQKTTTSTTASTQSTSNRTLPQWSTSERSTTERSTTQKTTASTSKSGEYTVDVNVLPAALFGAATGAGVYKANSRVTLVATPNKGYEFSGWYTIGNTDDPESLVTLVSTDKSYSFVITENKTFFAVFRVQSTNSIAVAPIAEESQPTTESTTESTRQSIMDSITTQSSQSDVSVLESIENISNSLKELNETFALLTQDVATLTNLANIVSTSISNAIASGQLDSDAIAAAVAADVQQAIRDGIIDSTKLIVESDVAVKMIEAAVAQIDFHGIATAVMNSNNVSLTASELQLAAIYAQYELYSVQADTTVVDAQKKAVDATKTALDVLKKQQQEMSAGWIATFDGTITEVDIQPGVQTTALSSGIKLENLDSMAVTVSLSEYDLHKVKVGMPAKIKTAYGEYDGEVTAIAPTATGGSSASILDSVGSMAGISGLSSLTASGAGVKCTVTIPETDENIIAGFDAQVEIETGEYLGVVAVPIESIKLEKTGSYVYLYNEEESTVTKTQIETGAVSDNAYQVKSGLKAGDKIVAAPAGNYVEDTFDVKVVSK